MTQGGLPVHRHAIMLVSGLFAVVSFTAVSVLVAVDGIPASIIPLVCVAVLVAADIAITTWAAPDAQAVGAALWIAERQHAHVRDIRSSGKAH